MLYENISNNSFSFSKALAFTPETIFQHLISTQKEGEKRKDMH